jgi:hypothetical protein
VKLWDVVKARAPQLKQLLPPRPTLSQVLRGWLPGALLVLLVCCAVLVASYRASERHYAQRLIAADSSCYLMGPALVVSGKDDFRYGTLLRTPAPLRSTDPGTNVYVLQTFLAWYLRDFLPLRPAMAVLLNGVWFTAMCLSVYALLWSRIRRWPTAALATGAFSIANPLLTSFLYGLTSLDPNLVGFMLATCAICWVILSDRFERLVPCALAGFFLGALALGRVYTLGIVLPILLPYVVACFWRRSSEQMVRSLVGGLLVLTSAYAICGWWVVRFWREVLAYPTQFGELGVLNRTSLLGGFIEWLYFPRYMFVKFITLSCVLTWPLAASLLGAGRGLRQFNWAALWMAVCPLMVLAKMGTTFQAYGAIALLGVFLLLLFPFRSARPQLVGTDRYAAALAIACALSFWAFFAELRIVHTPAGNNKRGTMAALENMRKHATDSGRKRVTLGLIHWGALHDAALVDALVFDLGVRVATPNYQPSRAAQKAAFVVDPLALDPWAWDRTVSGEATMTPDAWSKRLIEEADYVLVLAGGRGQASKKGHWPEWRQTSERVRASGVFERLGTIFHIPNDGPMELLVRKKRRAH